MAMTLPFNTPPLGDTIRLRNLSASTSHCLDGFGSLKRQPALISVGLFLQTPFTTAAAADTLDASTINYGTLSKAITSGLRPLDREGTASSTSPTGLVALAQHIDALCVALAGISRTGLSGREISISLPNGSLHGTGVSMTLISIAAAGHATQTLSIHGIRVSSIIGVNPRERLHRQTVVVYVSAYLTPTPTPTPDTHHLLEQVIVLAIRDTAFQTLEALALHVLAHVTALWAWHYAPTCVLSLRLEKPSAVAAAEGAAVEVVRSADREVEGSWAQGLLGRLGGVVPEELAWPAEALRGLGWSEGSAEIAQEQ